MDTQKKRVAFHNLGCKVNSYETEGMAQALAEAGFETVPFTDAADVYVINTCSVTNIADRKSRQMLHRAKQMNPDAVVVAAGCYAQASGEKLLEDSAVDIVIGNDRKSLLPELLAAYFAGGEKLASVGDIAQSRCYESLPAHCSEHTRAYVKIEDGCNQFCSYCLIPYVRGRVRSRSAEDILREAGRLTAAGFHELVLTGIHLSSYGLDMQGDAARSGLYGEPLLELMEALDRLPGLERLRLGSLEPRIVTPEFTARLAGLRTLCPHFHLSLQSGCDSVLRRMNRRYTAGEFLEGMKLLREAFDRPALTTDVICGFPGESEEEFAETVDFLKAARFYETHIFRYSRRRGTVADRMDGQLTEAVKAARSDVLEALNQKNKADFERSFLGERKELLLEEPVQGGALFAGYTREYVRLAVPVPGGEPGQLVTAEVTEDALAAGKGRIK